MDVKAYTKEFYKLSIGLGHMEDEVDKVARYLNGLKYSLQDELSLASPRTLEECYQLAMKVEEKLKMRKEKKSRGKGKNFRARGIFSSRGQSQRS